MDLLDRFKKYLKTESLIKQGDSVLLGVSGGPDSLAMMDLFTRLACQLELELTVFHLNHQFRREADAEAEFVGNISREYGLKAVIKSHDVPDFARKQGLSPEEAAREIRFRFLLETAEQQGADRIALAHNRDDLVETVLMNIFRGTGMTGLTGILPEVKIEGKQVIHPLLAIDRSQIEDYCSFRQLSPRLDPTNRETIYTRNKIRHEVIPYIEKEINPGVRGVIASMASIIREQEEFLDRQAELALDRVLLEKSKGQLQLDLDQLQKITPALRKRIIQKAIILVRGDRLDLYSEHLEGIEDLVKAGSTANRLDLPESLDVYRDYEQLIISQGSVKEPIEDYKYFLEVPGTIEVPGSKEIKAQVFAKNNQWKQLATGDNICLCDCTQVTLPLIVRNRRPGDRFKPLGMRGSKKLKDFFIDEKIPVYKRDKIPLVTDNRGNIIWIAGMRLDDRFKVKKETTYILKLVLKNREGEYS
ncbi:MAG: tRNA lysidine(34) synthetase TilS [Bacillota bacterium]